MRRSALAVDAATTELTDDASKPPATLKRRAAGGAVWVFLAFAAGKALAYVTNIVLARLLDPADFGVISFAMIFIGAFALIQDLGVGYAIVYYGGSEEELREFAGTALTINVLMALALFVASLFAAPFLAGYAHEPAIRTILPILAIGPILASLGSVQSALLVEKLAFRRKALPDIVPLVAYGVASIGLALLGFGVWSLVVGYLIRNLVATIIFWSVSSVRPLPGMVWQTARRLLAYGQHGTFNSIVGFAALNVDYFVIGHFLSAADLGIYTLAFTVATLPAMVVNSLTTSVLFSAYSRLKDDMAFFGEMFDDILDIIVSLSVVCAIGLFVCAPVYLGLILGSKWNGLQTPLEILTVFGVLRSIASAHSPAFRAAGRPDVPWKINLARLVVLAPLIVLSVRDGINGVAVVETIVTALVVPINLIMLARVVTLPATRLWRAYVPHAAGAALAVAVIGISRLVPELRVVGADPRTSWVIALAAVTSYGLALVSLSPRSAALARSAVETALASPRWLT